MTNGRTEPSLLNDAANLRGNTKHILITLYKSFMNIPKIDTDNSVLKRSVVLDIQAAKLTTQVETIPKLAQDGDIIRISLDKLKALGTVPTKQSYEIYSKQFLPFEDRIKKHSLSLDELLTLYKQIITEQHTNVRNLLSEINKAQDQAGMAGSQPVQRELAGQEAKLKELRERLSVLSKSATVTETELSSLHRLIYNAIPPAERKNIVSPEEVARARPTPGHS
ncbi:MAG: hypothetical protein P4M14_05735 [Gammaproteobacteria bacterium]|nr:hypothetical protein [Gammaproteobacteria bacterium]